MGRKRFIIWDPKDGSVQREAGVIVSDGVLGRLFEDNVYLTAYAKWPHGPTRGLVGHGGILHPGSCLEVGERIQGVVFALSGEVGSYDIYRVEDYPES